MSVYVTWDDLGHNVLRYEFTPPWTWNEFTAASELVQTMITETPHEVFVIMDVRTVGAIPPGSMTYVTRPAQAMPANTVAVFVVGANAVIQTLFGVFRALYGPIAENVMLCDTFAEAYAVIAERQTAAVRALC
ncbi:MAG: hypothetical protein GYB67_09140 [Chloroflexi bacterium]|nr:hypothetical protein [Chloroflexota bacterium]